MKQQQKNNCENTGLFSLMLAYFFPISITDGKTDVNTAMVSLYASRYMLRNTIGALLAFSTGEIFIHAGYSIIGESITGLFVIFTGLCSVFLCAMVNAHRKSD